MKKISDSNRSETAAPVAPEGVRPRYRIVYLTPKWTNNKGTVEEQESAKARAAEKRLARQERNLRKTIEEEPC